MPKSKHRKNQKKKAKARTENLKAKQNSFIKQFRERLDAGVQEELQKQADESREKQELDGTEEKTVLDTPMSTSPLINKQ